MIESKTIEDNHVEATSWFGLDAIANIVAGRKSELGKILNYWFLNERPNPSRMVFWLGSSMHFMEGDDLHRQSVVHPRGMVISKVLSLGMHEGLSGRKMLEAVLKGYDAYTRLGNSVGPENYRIWYNTPTCGTFGVAYVAGSLL